MQSFPWLSANTPLTDEEGGAGEGEMESGSGEKGSEEEEKIQGIVAEGRE